MAQKALYEEVIEEIGTQTLARFGLNIFSLNTYAAYGASVQMTLDANKAYNQHRNNPAYFGQTFEELDIGNQNIKDSLANNGNKTYTTDTLADIKNVREILDSGKKLENLNEKDRTKVEHILTYYGDEVKNMDFNKIGDFATKNHNTADTITLDKHGNVIKTAQLKVIRNTEGLLKDRYLKGDNAVDELKVPFDEYKEHKENLEKMIANGKQNPNDEKAVAKAEKAKIALEKLNASNTCNRLMAENPRTTAVITQSMVASGHIAQAGFSDAIVVTLSTLANGIIWEVKDMFSGKVDSETSIMTRIKRLLQKVKEAFQSNFARGAGFGAIDVVVGIVGQIFKSIAGSLRQLWSSLRTSAKSIYNGIYSYVKGDIKDFRTLTKTILKSLFSAAWVVGAVGLERQIESALLGIMPPLAPFIAPVLAIVAAAFAVVVTSRSIDMAVDALFGVYAARDKAKLRAEEIANLVAEKLPVLIENREKLEQLIEETHHQRLMVIDSSFRDYQLAYANNDDSEIYNALNGICSLYGETLSIKDMNDVKQILEKPNRTGKLQW
ncbi:MULTISPECIES: hypothetical protein [Helicobacter]|uniref:Uncharacterized protein n=1 Tax=Helicobacter bilis ATCC 43879 TaxID=613026 RepID=C3XH94_9HELI|nr:MULTISPECIES: hypothetical protein [Helicobacter]EEO24383.2 hypothetical protein HRAG_01440 [Helicobacter bilis ATCC 43879]